MAWDFEAPNCFPNPLPYGRCPPYPPLPPDDVSGPVPSGATLSGANAATGQRIGGTCGGEGSTARLLHGVTHLLRLGCGLTVDGQPGGWVWIEIEVAGAQDSFIGTTAGEVSTPGVATGVYTASSA